MDRFHRLVSLYFKPGSRNHVMALSKGPPKQRLTAEERWFNNNHVFFAGNYLQLREPLTGIANATFESEA